MHKFPHCQFCLFQKLLIGLTRIQYDPRVWRLILCPLCLWVTPRMSISQESWFHHLNTGAGVGGSGMLFSKAVLVLLDSVSLRNISRRTPTLPEMSQGRSLLSYTHLPNLRDGLPSAFFSLLFLSSRFITWNGSKAMDLCSSTELFSHPSIQAARAVIDYKRGRIYSFFPS